MNAALQSQIEQVLRHTSRANLAKCALARHGWGNSDGGFGTTYSTDVDDYERQVDGVLIPAGRVQLYGFWGLPDGYEFQITEAEYLAQVICFLQSVDHEIDLSPLERLRMSLLGSCA